MTQGDADRLESLLREAQGLKGEVEKMRAVLQRFYVPREEMNGRLSRLVLTGLVALVLVAGVGATFTIGSYRQLIRGQEQSQDEQVRTEIELVEHRIADKQGRRCILDYIDIKVDAIQRGDDIPPPRPEECGFAQLPDLERKLEMLQAQLDDPASSEDR